MLSAYKINVTSHSKNKVKSLKVEFPYSTFSQKRKENALLEMKPTELKDKKFSMSRKGTKISYHFPYLIEVFKIY